MKGSTKYVCQACGQATDLQNLPGSPQPRQRRVRCTGSCRGAKRTHVVAHRPITGHWRDS